MYKPGDTFKPAAPTYYAHPETEFGWCEGCAGSEDGRVCGSLPAGCSDEPRIIWKLTPYKAPENPSERPVTAAEYKPAHGGYPGTVRLS